MIDLNKPIRGRFIQKIVECARTPGGDYVVRWPDSNAWSRPFDRAQLEAYYENIPEPALDLNKPIRFTLTGEPRTVVVQPDGELHCFDMRGRICQAFGSAVEALRLYENYVPKIEPYEFNLECGATYVRTHPGRTIQVGIAHNKDGANPKIEFSKVFSQGDVQKLYNHLTEWLASVEPTT
jgi:hypothetical protein